HDVGTLELGQLPITEEVREAEEAPTGLSREVVAVQLGGRVRHVASWTQHHELVAFAIAGPVPVDHCELCDRIGLDAVQPSPQPRAALGLDELLVGDPIPGALETPLAHEGRTHLEVARDIGQRDAFDDAVAPKRRDRYIDVNSDIRTPRPL